MRYLKRSGFITAAIFLMFFIACGGGSSSNNTRTDNPVKKDPVKEDPVKEDPDDNNPGDNDPGDNDPGGNDPGDNDPGDNDPGGNDPGGGDPGGNDPGGGDKSGGITREELDQLVADGIIEIDEKSGRITFIDGDDLSRIFPSPVNSPKDAIDALNNVKKLLGIKDPATEFDESQVKTLVLPFDYGFSYKLQQMYKDVPVYAREIIISTDIDGNVLSLTSGYYPDIDEDFNMTSGFSEEAARAKACAAVKEKLGPGSGSIDCASVVTSSELVIYTLNGHPPVLAWRVTAGTFGMNDDYFINKSGIINAISNIRTTGVDIKGLDLAEQERGFTVNEKNGKYQLFDPDRKISIHEPEYGINGEFKQGIPITAKTTLFDKTEVSAISNIAATYDYYKNTLKRNSIDDAGMSIDAVIHYENNAGEKYYGSFWNGYWMAFGDGDGEKYVKYIDVVAHEYTHGVIDYTADFIYQGESGALHEAYADIFGELIEIEYKDDEKASPHKWIHGENLPIPLRRNLENPLASKQPVKVGGRNYCDNPDPNKNDFCDVHVNSTIISHAAYSMWKSGAFEENFAKLWYISLYQLTPTSEFSDVENALAAGARVLKKANLLTMTDAQIKEVINAAFNDNSETGIAPNLIGMSEEDAITAIEDAGFVIGTVTYKEENEDDDELDGKVINQTPDGGTSLEFGKPIDLTVFILTGGFSSETGAPFLIGMTEGEAKTAIITAGFVIGTVTYKYNNNAELKGKVIDQNPEAGIHLNLGESIDLTVSRLKDSDWDMPCGGIGVSCLNKIPNLLNMLEEAAKLTIKNEKFKIGTITHVLNTNPELDGIVIGQSPSPVPDNYQPLDTYIDLIVASLNDPNDTEPPTVPQNLTGTAISSTKINVSWTASTDNVGVHGYNVYVRGSDIPVVFTSVPSFENSLLSPSTEYCYQVSASDAAGNESGKSAEFCATTLTVDDLFNGEEIAMVKVDHGTFTMGCTTQISRCNTNEKPAHEVTLTQDFYIGKYEVTQAQWKAVMGSGNNPSYFKGDNLPVENVSWYDVQDFINKLNVKKPGRNYRLPTEAEWEYAARGGKNSEDYTYSGSNDKDKVAWHMDNSENIMCPSGCTHPGGNKLPNYLEIYDMSGNVYEWVNDYFENYDSSPQTDPQGPGDGKFRVRRGGAWHDSDYSARVSFRGSSVAPSIPDSTSGFRLASSAP